MNIEEFQTKSQSIDALLFPKFVYDVLEATEGFDSVQFSPSGGNIHWDLGAIKHDTSFGEGTKYFFLVKCPGRPLNVMDINEVVGRQYYLHEHVDPTARFVLVTSGVLTSSARQEANDSSINIWDSSYLARHAPKSVVQYYFGEAVEIGKEEQSTQRKAEALIELLNTTATGNGNAQAYQRLVRNILEFVFCPPLDLTGYEVSDRARRNRRDIILGNNATDGFWARLRSEHSAHVIVVDAKNHGNILTKRPVIDVSHYLKPYGCGMFALIVSRKGPGPAAEHATREEWIGQRKMIVVLSDSDLKEMVRLRADGGQPESILQAKIMEFRILL